MTQLNISIPDSLEDQGRSNDQAEELRSAIDVGIAQFQRGESGPLDMEAIKAKGQIRLEVSNR